MYGCGCFLTTRVELSHGSRDQMWPAKPRICTIWSFTEKPFPPLDWTAESLGGSAWGTEVRVTLRDVQAEERSTVF